MNHFSFRLKDDYGDEIARVVAFPDDDIVEVTAFAKLSPPQAQALADALQEAASRGDEFGGLRV